MSIIEVPSARITHMIVLCLFAFASGAEVGRGKHATEIQVGHTSSWCIGMAWCSCDNCVENKLKTVREKGLGRPITEETELSVAMDLEATSHPRRQVATTEYPAVKAAVDAVLEKLPDGKLKQMFPKCYTNTLDTTVEDDDKGNVGLVTGDIDAMWLRDSSAQIYPYVKHSKADGKLRKLVKQIMKKQVECILVDPYANAFHINPQPFLPNQNGGGPGGHTNKELRRSEKVFTGNYEMDSLAYPVWLAHSFWKTTGDKEAFNSDFEKAAEVIIGTYRTEQDHHDKSAYNYPELEARGRGGPLARTGMSWTGFRPSDDRCIHGYNVPGNMFGVVALGKLAEICQEIKRPDLAEKAEALAAEMDEGIQKHGTYDHPKYGKIYSYETDGMGHHVLMDDANVPSLLSIPYMGYKPVSDPVYQNTRRFVLSPDNPAYHEGKLLKGVGSPHTPGNNVWPMSLVMQGLTSTDVHEVEDVLGQLERSDADTGLMHESVNVDSPRSFTRSWFAWANSLFGELVEEYAVGKFASGRGA